MLIAANIRSWRLGRPFESGAPRAFEEDPNKRLAPAAYHPGQRDILGNRGRAPLWQVVLRACSARDFSLLKQRPLRIVIRSVLP
jgi:hypothetical protein